jgi:hypothetical protein
MVEFMLTSLTFEPPSRIINVVSDFVGELDVHDLEFVRRRCRLRWCCAAFGFWH